ncbi:MAG: hypothetical protein HY289_16850, partial [Planctomycetes bacterium]|nr:hypothetical protein [Planctomycetota bacterium]
MSTSADDREVQSRFARQSVTIFDLSDRAKIELAGRDAREFLTNLCTQDVKNLPVGETREAFLTTAKARVVAHVWIMHREPNVLLLDSVAGQAEKILQHLNHFLISEQVELADRTAELGFLRVVGAKAADTAVTPTRRHRWLALDGFDLICPAAELASQRQRLIDAGAVLADATNYQTLRIEAGLPEFGIDIDEKL